MKLLRSNFATEELPYGQFSNRIYNALLRSEVHTLGILLALSDKEFLRIPDLGQDSLDRVKEYFTSLGFEFFADSVPRKKRLHSVYSYSEGVPVKFLHIVGLISDRQLSILQKNNIRYYGDFRYNTQHQISDLKTHNGKPCFNKGQLKALLKELRKMGIGLSS